MEITWTNAQKQRLAAFEAGADCLNKTFSSTVERNRSFLELEKELVAAAKKQLCRLREETKRPLLSRMESELVSALTRAGFVQVSTPIMMSRGLLARMNITEKHRLFDQVYWVSKNKCLRPMLAPNLYYLLVDLLRLWEKPVSIFEIGSCFRKESRGAQHLSEFTMLNLVEMGLPLEQRWSRLKELAALVVETAGIVRYELVTASSEVYGETVDVVCGELELGSGAMGPHPLDIPWGITENWVGLGFGLERLAMAARKSNNIKSYAKSLSYLDGVRLNI